MEHIDLADISGFPEQLKAALITADGKSKLDLSKLMVAEDLTGIKTALQTEREVTKAYGKLGKPEELAAKIADLETKAAKGGKVGEDAQARLDKMASDHAVELNAERSKFTGMMERGAVADLKAELAKVGVIPEGLDMLATFGRARIQFGSDGTMNITAPDGGVMLGTGKGFVPTLSDLAADIAKTMPRLVADGGVGGGGKPAGGAGTAAAGKTVTGAQFETMDQSARMVFSLAGGKVIG